MCPFGVDKPRRRVKGLADTKAEEMSTENPDTLVERSSVLHANGVVCRVPRFGLKRALGRESLRKKGSSLLKWEAIMSKSKAVLLTVSILVLAITAELKSFAQSNGHARDLRAIEKLHQQDVAATLAGDPKMLAELWTDDAVRLEPGPAEVGKKLITLHDAETMKKHRVVRILTYVPEIQDIKIVDGWAFEWGYFNSSYRESRDAPVKSFRGKLLRVLQKQRDGSWKFARVMWNLAEEK
jgi:ketosteroid isomerase-like protein